MNIKHLIAGINPENISQLEIDKLAINAIRELELENEDLRQQLAQQPSVDVLVEALRKIRGIVLAASATDSDKLSEIVKIVVDRELWKVTDDKAMNQAKPIEKDVKK